MSATPYRKRRSLRFWLPMLVALFAIAGGLIVYAVGARVHRVEFEAEFTRVQMLRATRIQAEVERWIRHNDLEMIQSLFAELGVFPELKAAMFLDAGDTVLAATRRDALGRPLDIGRLGLEGLDPARLRGAMQTARQTMREIVLFTRQQNGLVVGLPTSLPLRPGELDVRRGGLILVAYDLSPEKNARLRRLQKDFLVYFANILVVTCLLGVCLHFLITRRLEWLEAAMTDFSRGKSVALPPLWIGDEISHLVAHFDEMASTIRKTMDEVRDLYNHAPCGYHSLDANGTFVQINDTELAWLGYTREEIVGRKKFPDLLASHGIDYFQREFSAFKERGFVKDLDFELVRKDGTLLPVVLSAVAIKDENGRFLMSRSVVYDVTERKRAAEKLNQLNAELEHRVELRTRQLEELNRELVAFSYSISHDLRTPLRSIDGFSCTLLQDYADQLDERGREDLQRVRAASQRMGRLIDDMVRLLQISRAEMRWSEVNLSRLAERVSEELKRTDPERDVEFVIAPDCLARGDPILLRIVLENALGNAWKYTRRKAQARIEFGMAETEEGMAYYVRDNGCGFDMRYARKLFGAFQRLHPATDFPGSGVGLACVRRVVQRHGGRTWIEGRLDEGTTLYFTLPATKPTW